MNRTLLLTLGMACALALSGCKLIVTPLETLVPRAPAAATVPPKISNLAISPSQAPAGATTPINLSFDYEDLNADIDSNSAGVELQLSVLAGTFALGGAPERVFGLVIQDDAHWGRQGRVTVTRALALPASDGGTVGISLTLVDAAGQRSNPLNTQLAVLPSKDDDNGGGVGPGGERCTILDGDRNPVTLVRIGRQVFFRVKDPDNNFSSDRQDRLFRVAGFQAGASGDVEIIPWMVETGVNTGIFEGPAGGVLLTSRRPVVNNGELSVLDGDTVMAIYEDPNGVGDVCIAVAKVP